MEKKKKKRKKELYIAFSIEAKSSVNSHTNMNASNPLANSPWYGYSLGRIVRLSNKSITIDTAKTKTSANPFDIYCIFA